MSEIKNPGKSIRAKLLNVAKQKDVFYQTILTRYFRNAYCTVSHKLITVRTST